MKFFIVALSFFLLAAPAAFAAPAGAGNSNPPAGSGNPPPSSVTGPSISLLNPLGAGTSIPKLLDDLLQFVITIGTIVVVLMVIYIGFLFVAAQGNKDKLQKTREMLLWTLVGALVLLGAKAIALGIQATVAAISN